MTRHSAKHARPAKRPRPAKPSRRDSHKRGSHWHAVLAVVPVAVVCVVTLVVMGRYCADFARSEVTETGSLEWRLLHYAQIGWHRKECVEDAKMAWEAVEKVGEHLKRVGGYVKDHPPRKL